MPKVTVITATTGNPKLSQAILSVANQTHKNVEHLLIVDGPERYSKVDAILGEFSGRDISHVKRVDLPYSIGKDRWNGHRIYPAGTYMADGEYVMFLDDDNYLDENHIKDCLETIKKGNTWAYSMRKIIDEKGYYICNDDCESLGKWASVLHPEDFFVDVNCYFLPTILAVQISPFWYRKFREPGQPEVDRVLCHVLRQVAPQYDSTYKYSINYVVGNTENSVKGEFFIKGNEEMAKRYKGELPWKK